MASIYSSSSTSSLGIYNSLTASNKGIGGLVSGLNTDEIVEALVSGTRNKIAGQNQAKTKLQWQQSAYQSVAAGLRALQSKYLTYSSTSSTHIGSLAFWNVYNASSTNEKKVTASGTSAASPGNITIQSIQKLATECKLTVNDYEDPLIGDKLDFSDLSPGDFIGKQLQVSFNGVTKTIKLDSLETYNAGAMTSPTDIQAELQNLLTNAFGTGNGGSPLVTVSLETLTGTDVGLKLDGGAGTVKIVNSADLLGLTAGLTSRIDTSLTIEEFAKLTCADWDLVGDTFRFSVNGAEIQVSKTNTIAKVMSKVTNSAAGVNMTYDNVTQQFVFTSKTTGGGDNIQIEDIEGNLMSEWIGARGGTYVAGTSAYTGIRESSTTTLDAIVTAALSDSSVTSLQKLADYMAKHTMALSVNGEEITLNLGFDPADPALSSVTWPLSAGDDMTIAAAIRDSLNKQIEDSFGEDVAQNVKFTLDASGTLTFDALSKGGNSVSLSKHMPSSSSKDAFRTLFGTSSTEFENAKVTQYDTSVKAEAPSDYLVFDRDTGAILSGIYAPPGGVYTMEVTVNGVTRQITVDTTATGVTLQDLIDQLTIGNDENGTPFANINDVYLAVATAQGTVNSPPPGTTQAEIDKLKREITRLDKLIDNYWANLDKAVRKDLEDQLNDSLEDAFITTASGVEMYAEKMTFSVGDDGTVTLKASDGTVSFEISQDDPLNDLFGALNFSTTPGVTSVQNEQGTLLSEISGLDPTGSFTFSYGGNLGTVSYNTSIHTVQDIINQMNMIAGREVVTFVDGKFVIDGGTQDISFKDGNAESPPNPGNFMEVLFGLSDYETKPADNWSNPSGKRYLKEGENAIVIIDKQVLDYTTNEITYNGVNITLHETHNTGYVASNPTTHDDIRITVTADVDSVIDKVQEFIEDYNASVEMLNSFIKDEKSKGYDPLTDEQKAEMTESEINMWETEAKKGILRNDSNLRSILDQMRTTMYMSCESAGIALYDLGITTMSSYNSSSYSANDAGKLMFDVNKGTEILREKLTTNPDQVRLLFTDEEQGLATRLENVLTNAVSDSYGKEGTLVRLAGSSKNISETSSIDKKIERIDEYIARLKIRLENEYTRYWNQFAALETALLKFSSQSSYLDGIMNSN